MRTIRYRNKPHGMYLAYKIISFTKKCHLMNCSKVIKVETKSYLASFSDIWQKKMYLRNSETHMLSKIAKSKFTPFFHVREQFITEKVTLLKILLYLKVGSKKQLYNQVANMMSVPLGIILHKTITLNLDVI